MGKTMNREELKAKMDRGDDFKLVMEQESRTSSRPPAPTASK